MKGARLMRVISAVILALLVCALTGCSGHKQTIITKEGAATVETNQTNDTTTITTNRGTAVVGKNAVDLSKLDVPVYPGASSESGGLSVQSNEGNQQIAMLTTSDSFDKVYDWYKNHMPAGSEKLHMTSGGSSMAQFAIGTETDKHFKSVMITQATGKTAIQIVVGSK